MIKIEKGRFLGLVMTGLVGLAALSGCSLYQDGTVTEHRVQVIEEKFVEEVPLTKVNDQYIVGLSRHYEKHGDGPIALTVAYDPHSKSNTAMKASHAAARIVRGLRDQGVRDVKADILPLQGQGDEALVVVSYLSYKAAAPKDCGVMPGIKDTDIGHKEEYRMGCTIETLLARQIARPKDLLGRGRVDPTSSGRKAANIGDIYRGGVGNAPLEGLSASE